MTSLARRVGIYSVAAAVAASSCGAAAAPTAPASSSPVKAPPTLGRIVVLGDSLSVSPSRSVNFPAELQARLDSATRGWTVHNAGVSGDTTAGGVRRLDEAVAGDTHVLILALGANDGLRGVSLALVETNLSAMIERAQARRIKVLLCGMETPPSHGWDYTIGFHKIFPRLAARYDVPLVPFLLAGVALDPALNLDDAIHPNAAGARRIGDTVWPYLEPLVRTQSAAAFNDLTPSLDLP
jgi:acyl-CoA thioesterase I